MWPFSRCQHALHLLHRLAHRLDVVQVAGARKHGDVRVGPEDLAADILLEPGRQRQGDDQRRHAHRDAEHRDERDERQEGLLALGQEIAQGQEQFVGHLEALPECH
jgi:hypothetical protein